MIRILLGLAFLTGACDDIPQNQPHANTTLEETLGKNPETEAADALGRGDHKLMGVRGYALEVPGTDLPIDEVERRFGVVEIAGTSDVYDAPGDRALNERARQYAARYNRYIIQNAALPNNP